MHIVEFYGAARQLPPRHSVSISSASALRLWLVENPHEKPGVPWWVGLNVSGLRFLIESPRGQHVYITGGFDMPMSVAETLWQWINAAADRETQRQAALSDFLGIASALTRQAVFPGPRVIK